nr:hypothetical protein [Verrucomicrobiota bacterium]
QLEKEKLKTPEGERKTIYDQEKVARFFEQRRLSLRNLDLRVAALPISTRVNLQFVPRPNQGEPIDAAARVTSQFQSNLRRFKTGNTVVWFHVARDSFEAYTRAREIVDAFGIPAGWEPVNQPLYAQALTDFEVNRLAEPPPIDPNQIRITPPKKTLD